ncbi:MAG: tyrosine-type recombinase/integrase, partial [Nocardioidaceae bacterium]
ARARPLSPATHNAYRARLASFFAHAMRRGWIRVDPMVDVHRMKVPQRLRQRPAPDLLADVIDQADDDRDRAILATLVTTALRQNSVRLLRIGDVDLAHGWLRVNVTKTLQHDETPITTELDSTLRRWLISYAATIDRPLREQDHSFPARFVRGYRWRTLEDGTREKVSST